MYRLPELCAAYLLSMKPHLEKLLGPDSNIQVLEWALNATCGAMKSLDFEFAMVGAQLGPPSFSREIGAATHRFNKVLLACAGATLYARGSQDLAYP